MRLMIFWPGAQGCDLGFSLVGFLDEKFNQQGNMADEIEKSKAYFF